MKKIFTALICTFMFLGMSGCSFIKKGTTVDKTIYKVGETVKVDGINILVNAAKVEDDGGEADKGKIFYSLNVTIENTTKEEFDFDAGGVCNVQDSKDEQMYLVVADHLALTKPRKIAPKEKISGDLVFETTEKGDLFFIFNPKEENAVKIQVR